MMVDAEIVQLASEVDTCPDSKIGEYYDIIVGQLNREPEDHRLRLLFATIAAKARHFGVAKLTLDSLLRSHGDWGPVRFNLAMVMDSLGNQEAALRHYQFAERDPKSINMVMLHSNRATALIKLGRYEESIKACDKSLAIDCEFKDALITKGFGLLSLGKLAEGWDHYQQAMGGKHRRHIEYGVPLWKGEPDCRVILHGEQGIGDEIMYASCIPDVIAISSMVAVDCDARLSAILKRSFPNALVMGSRTAKPEQKAWVEKFKPTHSISLASLPVFYRRTPEAFPKSVYLRPKPSYKAMYRKLFQHETGKEKLIGIGWSGGTADTKEVEREIPLEAFAKLIEKYPDHGFVSLQYREDAQAQIDASGLPIHHFQFVTGKGASYEHTAAAIAACDKVVSTDTTAIHAAGAMGVPTHCLLSTPPMWVHAPWQGKSSPWYRDVALHRKPEGKDWLSYINSLVAQGDL